MAVDANGRRYPSTAWEQHNFVREEHQRYIREGERQRRSTAPPAFQPRPTITKVTVHHHSGPSVGTVATIATVTALSASPRLRSGWGSFFAVMAGVGLVLAPFSPWFVALLVASIVGVLVWALAAGISCISRTVIEDVRADSPVRRGLAAFLDEAERAGYLSGKSSIEIATDLHESGRSSMDYFELIDAVAEWRRGS